MIVSEKVQSPADEKAVEVRWEELTKKERDRILMPPPPSSGKKAKPSPIKMTKVQDEELTPAERVTSKAPPAAETVRTMKASMQDDAQTNGVPEGFFEMKSKKADAQLQKERTAEKVETEYVRFQKEVESSLDAMTEKEVIEEEASDIHRQETEAHEQQQRLDLVQRLKAQRQHIPFSNPTPAADPNSEGNAMETESSSDDDEIQWRGKAL